ncbi:MAG: hypothetical protein QOD41_4584 [Cryptosporangiaceae bacterium]|nr:hypothetical protein [Cryptosporangiaceae bacterium]
MIAPMKYLAVSPGARMRVFAGHCIAIVGIMNTIMSVLFAAITSFSSSLEDEGVPLAAYALFAAMLIASAFAIFVGTRFARRGFVSYERTLLWLAVVAVAITTAISAYPWLITAPAP